MSPVMPKARGHVLVVDDENGPRQSLRLLLKEYHDVFLAPDVESALAKAQAVKTA